jgi:Na+-driven multidrug efflux pump
MKEQSVIRVELKQLKIHWDKLRKILQVGIPTGLQSILFSLSNVLIQSAVNSFGATVVAGGAAAGNIEGFT